MDRGSRLYCGRCGREVARAGRRAGEPWRSVLAEVARWAELRARGRPEDRYALLVAEVEQRNAGDLLRAAGWCS